MATILSPFTKGTRSTKYGDCAGDSVVNHFYADLTAAQVAAGNIVDIGILPAGHTVVDSVLVPDDLDTNGSPTITLDVGIMSGTPGDDTSVRTCGAELFSASTAAQGGTPTRMSAKTGFLIPSVGYDRSIGVKINAGAATAAAGRVRVLVTMAPSDGNQF
ncbi:MAG TPA: hypothetical protein VJ652_15055 [Noviherbaspirillum sp.]|nr:hypothetical protein [Noviherbaspirillum sp.]